MYHRKKSYKTHSKGFIEDSTPNAEKALFIFFHLTIASAFYGSALFSVETPIGSIFPFRILVPITAVLFLGSCITKAKNPLKDLPRVKLWGVIFGLSLEFFGIVSLFRATSFSHTFRRLFNLSFVMLLFILVILYLDNHRKIRAFVCNLTINTVIILLMGIYETFGNNYVFIDKYIGKGKYNFFDLIGLKPATVTFANTNDLNAGIFMIITAISCYYIFTILKSSNERLKNVYSCILIFLFVASGYLAECSGARLVKISFYLYVFMMLGVFYFYSKKRIYIPIIILLCSLTFSYGGDYFNINARAINTTNDVVYYAQKAVYDTRIKIGSEHAVMPMKKPHIPLRDKISLEDEFFSEDENGNSTVNLSHSGGIRLALIESAFKMFAQSKTLGVGLGNGEMILKAHAEQTGGITNFHCYPARLIAEYGIFIIIPALVLVYYVLTGIIKSHRISRQKRDTTLFAHILTVITALLVFPLLVTAPSDAQDIAVMWIYIAFYLCAISSSDNGNIFNLLEDRDDIDFQRLN
ncbi:MAG: hypothetical protein RR048_01500 [Oscillospiraceae bacterium]